MTKRNQITRLQVEEISGVDKAAQVPAEALLRKRADGLVTKNEFARPFLTSEVRGHQHVLDDTGAGGETSWLRSEGEENGHSHSWVRMLDGTLTIGAADGHSHEVLLMTHKTASGGKEQLMTETKTAAEAQSEAVQKSIADLTTRAERSEAVIKLNAAERGLFDGFSPEDQSQFLAKSATERADAVRNSQDANRVVYKSTSGDEYRANDDVRLVKMAKDRDAEKQRMEKAMSDLLTERLTKRAEVELSHCPGTVADRAGILKALDGVSGAVEFLKAADASLAKAFTSQGVSGGGGVELTKASDRLEVLAVKFASDNKLSIEKARAEVLETPEGGKLYMEMDAEAAA